jgi:DegV family protein with EDD domain
MTRKICIAVDSACDLSPEYIEQHRIEVLPIYIRLGKFIFVDLREPEQTLEFYRKHLFDPDMDAETEPLSVEELGDQLDRNIVANYDGVQIITINAKRSQIHANASRAAFVNMQRYKRRRTKAGILEPFHMRVFDSGAMFTGQAVMVHEVVRLMEEEQYDLDQIQPVMESLRERIRSYVVPRDLYHLHARAARKGDSSVGWLKYKIGNFLDIKPIIQCYRGETSPVDKAGGFDNALGRLLDRARKAVERGLATRFVAMSYAGDLGELPAAGELYEFQQYLQDHGIDSMLSPMSATAAINVGPGAFSLGYAEQ